MHIFSVFPKVVTMHQRSSQPVTPVMAVKYPAVLINRYVVLNSVFIYSSVIR